jgi:small subunit ribosomal protein S11
LNDTKAPAAVDTKVKRKKGKRSVPVGVAHIYASFNNTIVSITDPSGGIVAWASAGSCGFKGSRKSTPYASQVAGSTAADKAKEAGVRQVSVLVTGPGSGRESAVRSLALAGIQVTSIKDITPMPHNGCRPRKSRRV